MGGSRRWRTAIIKNAGFEEHRFGRRFRPGPPIYRVHAIALPIFWVYKIEMGVEFDPAKDEANSAKHGVSLKAAERFDWDTALVVEDDRFDYGEVRFYAVGYIGNRLHTLIYADGTNEHAIRAISLWPSTRSEVKRYETQV
jgi:uncharacterized DUF497 family protein